MFGDYSDNKRLTREQAVELKQNMRRALEEFRTSGKLDYPLNDEGKVARLEDARDLAKLLSNEVIELLMDPNVQMIMAFSDPIKYQFFSQLALLAHTLVCTDPECKINNPELGVDEGAA
jgi:MarR-like DNA-binding transcriptional regulator SgrR of sgrS sRNA